MTRSDFLRFAFIIGDGQTTTFNRNLAKIVKSVLFDEYGTSITINQIIDKIQKTYSLEFSDAEVLGVIRRYSAEFIETHSTKDPVYHTYTIRPNEYEKMKEISPISSIETMFTRFIEECCLGCSYESVRELIYKHIYHVFNVDISTILALMNYKEKVIDVIDHDFLYSTDEIAILNAFLNWDDKIKDQFMFKVISSCFDYCMLTVRKDNSSYNQLFTGKEFYLDSNIIFRLAGFNSIERQNIVESFTKKCKHCGVKLKYTNFTQEEINSTLSYHVNNIQRALGRSSPICIEAMEVMSSKYANIDFYRQYLEWTQKPGNVVGDYPSFLLFLKRKVFNVLTGMEFVINESNENGALQDEFTTLVREFSVFKGKRYKEVYEASVKTDIENYMFMRRLDRSVRSNSFLDKKHYFITADHTLIDWTKEKLPGTIPAFVLPSVWYSIMLKYTGRADDDYRTCCNFMNIRQRYTNDGLEAIRQKILDRVLALDETTEVKEEIIFSINQQLTNIPDDFDVEHVVQTTLEGITATRVSWALAEAEVKHDQELADYQKKVNVLVDNNDTKYSEGLEQGKREGVDEGRRMGAEEVYRHEAEKIKKRNEKIWRSLSVLSAAACILSLVLIAYLLFTNKLIENELIKTLNEYSGVLVPAISGIIFVASRLLPQKTKFLSVDEELIYSKLIVKNSKLFTRSMADKYTDKEKRKSRKDDDLPA